MSKNFKINQELIFFDDAFCITTDSIAEYNLCSNFAGSSTEYTQSGNGHALSGGHSIMMVQSTQPDEGGCTPTHFHYIYYLPSRAKCGVLYAPAEKADTPPLPYFSSTPICTLWAVHVLWCTTYV